MSDGGGDGVPWTTCSYPFCLARVRQGEGRCPKHARKRRPGGERSRRDYGRHWAERARGGLRREPWCARCGMPTPATERDHIVPKAWGGRDDAGNLWSLCSRCHARKTRMEGGFSGGGEDVGAEAVVSWLDWLAKRGFDVGERRGGVLGAATRDRRQTRRGSVRR